ncbi:RNA editing complex protein MP99 [Trypanosoma conorhini]|uniref:RNA editing complex protein MP99 n=1 Tax=Trypanosoma conorhini TaxID=83891 RepID=A0A422PB25_9TRYP|nr:RNA editing complex protein MP99 [Trypanosoma conorhini]RNF14921.1 RNA editing complex protein MP99 [Trypanosoma conorhini]
MLRRCRTLWTADFRTSAKISDEFNNVLNRSGWGFDHVAIDMGALAGAAGRLTRDLIGQDRDAETVKVLHRQVTNVILRRIQPKKSLAIFIDGSEPLWKVRHMRLYPGKKFEGKFYRSAASPMVYLLEDKMRHVAVDLRTPPKEFVVSGAAVPGPVEGKISSWMLDLASRALPDGAVTPSPPLLSGTPAEVTFNDTFCLIGGTDLFLSALGATPFHNITTVTLQQGEMKSLSMSESLEWLAMDHLLKGETATSSADQGTGRQELQKRLALVRTDIVFLYLMANGISATDLSGLGVNFKELMEAYTAEEAAGAQQQHLFEETPNDASLLLSPGVLERVLARATRKTGGAPRPCRQSADYLEVLLQTHAMICSGGIRNFRWTPEDNDTVPEKPPKILLERFLGHLRYLNTAAREEAGGDLAVNATTAKAEDQGKIPATVVASADYTFALTGLETLLLSAPKPEMIEQIIPVFTRGHALPAGVAEDIVNTKNVLAAIEKTRSILQVVKGGSLDEGGPVLKEHAAFDHQPSHYFVRTPGFRGPPPGWSYQSINLGVRAAALGVRYRAGVGASTVTSRVLDGVGVASKNTLFVYTAKENGGWGEEPCEGIRSTELSTPTEELSTLRVVTWNVQFSRHSGERTPLGRDGIDWCTPTRYVALAKTLEALDADVIGMQEVEPAWWKYLSEQPWVRERYALSCNGDSHVIRPWGVMLLVRRHLRVEGMHHANVPAFAGHTSVMPEVTIAVSKKVPVTIGSLHLLAPYNKNNVNNRTTQLENLTKRMRTRPSLAGSLPGAIVMGDFNDCASNYFTFPPEMGFKDAWSLLHPEDDSNCEGYTIDGNRNAYAGHIIEREFFGRADRVLFASRHLQPIHTELVGTTPVRGLGITRQVNCDKAVPEYLYPSDHFGLLVEFQVV